MKQFIQDGKTLPNPNQYFFYNNPFWVGVTGQKCTLSNREPAMHVYYISLSASTIVIDRGIIEIKEFENGYAGRSDEDTQLDYIGNRAKERICILNSVETMDELLFLIKLQEM